MNWNRLKENKCPNTQCGSKKILYYNARFRTLECVQCGFRITEERLREIVTEKVVRNLESEKKLENVGYKDGYGTD